jgi:pimeloyl-ACP methyl ester carboxylesterase
MLRCNVQRILKLGGTMHIDFLQTSRGSRIAYQRQMGEGAGVLFLSGFKSDMQGSKAEALAAHCQQKHIPFTRFDYFAHGQSEGDFLHFSISKALEDTLDILDFLAPEPQILVGSSMGGWLMLLAALERKQQVKALIGIAAAPDFTERLMYSQFTPEMRATLEDEGVVYVPSDYGFEDYPISKLLIEDGRQHQLLNHPIPLEIPVALLHGQCDPDVPWEYAHHISNAMTGGQVSMHTIKDGDHRLSRPQDISLLLHTLEHIRHLTDDAMQH